MKKNLKNFILDWESNPDVWDDRIQHFIQSSHLESRPLANRNIPVDGNGMNGNIWNDSYLFWTAEPSKKFFWMSTIRRVKNEVFLQFQFAFANLSNITSTIRNISVSTCLTEIHQRNCSYGKNMYKTLLPTPHSFTFIQFDAQM